MMHTNPFIEIAGRKIGRGEPCFIIAEMSANHHQKFEEAAEIIKAAAAAGADAVKMQTYTPDTMTIDSDKKWFFLGGEGTPGSWKGKNLYALYQTAYTPWEWQPKLKRIADERGILLFSTPFDSNAVDFLEKELHPPCYKIASYESTDTPLLRRVAKTGKPVIISIGFASLEESREAVRTLRESGAREIAVLHCVTTYKDQPSAKNMNLRTIADIRERFGVVSGFSDNNAGIEFPIIAVMAGASVVEKHLILSRAAGGHDERFSIEPQEFKEMVLRIREAEQALGSVHYGPTSVEEENYKILRRSLFVVEDMKRGDMFTHENIRVIRPAYGLAPKYLDEVLGKKAAADIERGTPLSLDLIA